jgi:hypothetical protein
MKNASFILINESQYPQHITLQHQTKQTAQKHSRMSPRRYASDKTYHKAKPYEIDLNSLI